MYMYAIGLFLLGAGWNFGFSASTVLLTKVYANDLRMKSKIQSSHDFVMFVVAGIIVVSAGYIYNAADFDHNPVCGALCGWKTVNYATFGFMFVLLCVILFEFLSQKNESKISHPEYIKLDQCIVKEGDC